jgi:hypothetical protein
MCTQQMALVLADRPLQVKQLKCCLTFVNVSWQAIVNDLSQAILGPTKAGALIVDEAAP